VKQLGSLVQWVLTRYFQHCSLLFFWLYPNLLSTWRTRRS